MIDLLMRRREMTSKPLPYDAEVEYLKSTGSQYINTGIMANAPLESDVVCEFISGSDSTLLGARTQTTRIYLVHRYNGFCIGYGSYYSASGLQGNVKYTINTILESGTQKMTVDGVVKISKTDSNSISLNLPLYIFAQRYSTSTQAYIQAKLYSCAIKQNGMLVRDYIPVRKGNIGYLYDKVSGQLFGNAGTGAFTYGNDVS